MRYKLIDEYIGNKLKEERQKKGLSMQDVCNSINIKQRQRYYNYENAKNSMPFELYKNACKVLGIDYIKTFKEAQEYMFKNEK